MSDQPKWTPGPWEFRTGGDFDGEIVPPHIIKRDVDEHGRRTTAFVATFNTTTLPDQENARLSAAAPAQELALSLIGEGLASIERIGTLREFCFDGLRYVLNGDWNDLFETLGWDKARAALAKARGGDK